MVRGRSAQSNQMSGLQSQWRLDIDFFTDSRLDIDVHAQALLSQLPGHSEVPCSGLFLELKLLFLFIAWWSSY
jgi:hypothetical protein